MSEIGNFLFKLRADMSLRTASIRSGLSHTYIRQLEKGEHPTTKAPIFPSPDTLKRLASAYSYSYEELLKVAGITEATSPSMDRDVAILQGILSRHMIDLSIPKTRLKIENIIAGLMKDDLSMDHNVAILQDILSRHQLDLTKPKAREKLEKIIEILDM